MRRYVQKIEGYRPRGQPSSTMFGAGFLLVTLAMLGAIPIMSTYLTDRPDLVWLIGGLGGFLMVTAYLMAYMAGKPKTRRKRK